MRGTYVQGLTEGDLWRLDIFEGDEYERRKVKIKWIDRKGEGEEEVEVEVETYVWIAGEHRLEKGEWDFEEFTREKIGRWVGGEEYDGESTRPSILGVCVSYSERKATFSTPEAEKPV